MRFCLAFSLLAAIPLLAADSADEKAVTATVQKLFDAMKAKDAAAIRSLVLPGATFASVRADGKTSVTPVEKFADAIGAAKDVLVEKMWDAKAMVQDKAATLIAPYDFHRGEAFTHCGIDAFTLLKVGDEWKIASVSYTVQQQGCASK